MAGLTKVTHPQYRGYDEYLDDTGKTIYTDKSTGEVIEAINVNMPVGSRVVPPKQVDVQNQYRKRRFQLEAGAQTRAYNKKMSFYFTKSKDRREDQITPQALARLFFAASYIRHNDNALYRQDGQPMSKADLRTVMRLRSSAFKDWWNEVEGRYIFPQVDGSIKISDEFYRGSLVKRGENTSEYQQIFIRSIRELYWQTDVRKHRYLGYIFMIMHKISWEYNILCENPEETERDKIKPISLDDFSLSMGAEGYTTNQKQRLIDAFRALKFKIGDTEQYLIAYLEDHVANRYYLVVNPNLLYRGSDRKKVDGYGHFFPALST